MTVDTSYETRTLPAGSAQSVVGVVMAEGGDFAEAMFAIESEGAVSVMLRGPDDRERIDALGVSHIVTPQASSGWVTPAPVTSGPAGSPARIVYSSGTTGTPKAILVTHGNIGSTAARLIDEMEMTADIREYIGVPLNYSFGLARARTIAQVGGRYYVPPHGFDPSEIADLLKTGEINAISAVPTLWRILIANADILGTLGEGIRWIEIGSQAMSADEKLALRKLFPNAAIVQHYGLTEASRTTFLRIDRCSENQLASVGNAGRGTEIEIGETGLIHVRGPHVSPWKLEDGSWQPLTDSDGWLVTGDFGHIEDGYLHFDGRADDLINCGGTKISPDAMEREIAAKLRLGTANADRIAVARITDALRGDAVLVAHEAGLGLDDGAVRDVAMAALAGQGLAVGSVLKIAQIEALPRTATGKILRRDLGAAYMDGTLAAKDENKDTEVPMEATPQPTSEAAGSDANVGGDVAERLLALWRTALGRDDVDPEKSFYDVGGDSLSAIGLALSMERAGFDADTARSIFEGRTISEIAAAMAPAAPPPSTAAGGDEEHHAPAFAEPLPEAPTRTETNQIATLSEGLNLVKGWLIICMVTSHWLPIYLQKFGLRDTLGHKVIQPFLSMGSPTLGFCFGIGASIFYARQSKASQTSFRRSIRMGSLLLLGGVIIGGVMETAARLASGDSYSVGLTLTALAGGPFVYFLLATLSLPLWVGRIERNLQSALWLFAASIAALMLFEIGRRTLHLDTADLMQQALEGVLIGHWSLAQMGGFTLAGAGTGVLIEMMIARNRPLSLLSPVGLLLIPAGILLALAADDFARWFVPHENIIPWAVVSYVGITLYVVGRIGSWKQAVKTRPFLRALLEIVATLGILLFPLYILQSLVYHGAAAVSEVTGRGLVTIMTVLIAIWFVLAAWATIRMRRLYYGR